MQNKVLICGFGSIGRLYAKVCEDIFNEIFIYDSDKEISLPENYHFIEEVNQIRESFDLIIDATHADNRVHLVKKLIKHTKLIITEKLLCNDYSQINEWENLARNKNLSISATGRWEVLSLNTYINKLSKKYNLGNTISLNITGGNCCLSTGGSHWISNFFSAIEQTDYFDKLRIDFNISIDSFNPRSEDLEMLSGDITIRNGDFPFRISFHKNSRISVFAEYIFEYGRVYLNQDGSLTCHYYSSQPKFRHIAHYVPTDASINLLIEHSNEVQTLNISRTLKGNPISIIPGVIASKILIYAASISKHHNKSKYDVTLEQIDTYFSNIEETRVKLT